MSRLPFLGVVFLTATLASESQAVGPRRPVHAAAAHFAAPHMAAPHAAAPHFAAPHMAAPIHPVARPTPRPTFAGHGFVPTRPAHTFQPTRPAVTTVPHGGHTTVGAPHVVNRPQYSQSHANPTIVNRNVNRTNVYGGGTGYNPYARQRATGGGYAGNAFRSGGYAGSGYRSGGYGGGGYARGGYGGGFGGSRWAGGRQFGAARSWYSSPGNWGRTWWGGSPAWYWGMPWYWQHSGWHHGFWNYWDVPPALWFGAGLTSGWLYSPYDTVSYFNPYFVTAVADVPTYLDYAQPLPAVPEEQDALALPPDPTTLDDPNSPPAAPTDPLVADAKRLLGDARAAFQAGDYPKAQVLVEGAIKATPSDPALHEFRALTLFAQGRYQDMAADLFAVLTAGPGWDWATMRDQYPNVDTYTAQLRALERAVGDNPTAAYGHFDLAYEYLVIGSKDAAVRELQQVVKLQPDDKLSAALLQSLTNPQAASDTTGPPVPGR